MKTRVSGRFPSCPTAIFDPATCRIGPHTVVFIDNRPGDGVHLYHRKIEDHYALIQQVEGGVFPENMPTNHALDPSIHRTIEVGLAQGWFRDTTRIAEWIGAINAYANFGSIKAEPLELVIAHGETHIEALIDQIVSAGVTPAGVILSGSPKMLGEVLETPVIQATLRLVRHCLDRDVPTLGICFGLHLLAYARYGALAEYITVPEGMGVEFYRRHGSFSPVTAAARRTVYGCPRIHRIQRHPIMNQVDRILALEVHSQYLWPGHPRIPPTAILAKSKRLFRPSQLSSAAKTVAQEMVEVLSCGPWAVGTQLHPELTPELLLVLTHFPQIVEMLARESQPIDLIRKEIREYPGGTYFAGQRVGYNWVKRIVALAYIVGLEARQLVSARTRETLLRRLVEKDPTAN